MHFAQPAFLVVAAALGVVLVALFVRLAAARRRALAQLGSPHLLATLTASVARGRRLLKQALLVGGVVLFGLALARPQLGYRWEQAHRRGVDLLFAVDTSKSMLTSDVKPNRLDRAKLAVRDLVERFPNDRVGLVAFAGTAFLQTPLTLDHGIFEQSLAALDTSVIPLGGTNVGSALETAGKALSDDTHRKVVVLLTDGEDLSGDALAAAERAGKQGLAVYTVGVGTPNGELIPVSGPDGQTQFVKDDAGRFVTSKLDESLLRRIASATGAAYRALGDNGRGLDALYREELSTLPRSDLAARTQRVPLERFQWPLGLGLLLLAIEPLLGERGRLRRARPASPPKTTVVRHPRARRVTSAAAAVLTLLGAASTASASPQSAERAYQQGRFSQAQHEYEGAAKSKPGDPRLDFNWGAAAYKSGDLENAKRAFESTLRTDDLKLQQRTYYNLGDVLYRSGERTLAANKTDDTIRAWQQAISHYEAALRLEPSDADAKHNLELVKRKLADLQKKQDQQKQDQQKQDQQKQDQQKQDQQKDQQKEGSQQKPDQQKQGPQKAGQQPGQPPRQGRNQTADSAPSGTKQGSKSGAGANPPPTADSSKAPPDGKAEPKPDPSGQAAGAPGSPKPGAGGEAQGEPEAPARPGELSKADARALLDSLRGDLQLKPNAKPSQPAPDQEQPRKDW